MRKVDFIVVGQGIAGSVLSYFLLKAGHSIVVIDEANEDTSSKIAAGMCNPVVFKRLTKSWMVDELLPIAKNFYAKQSELLGEQFFYDVPIYRLFTTEKEQEYWRQQSNEPHLFDWLGKSIENPFNEQYVKQPFGGGFTLQSGYVDTRTWLDKYSNHLNELSILRKERFNFEALSLKKEAVLYKDIEAQKVIFCEGYGALQNPYFSWLPFKLTKGEVLSINFENLKLDAAVNKGAFLLPQKNVVKLGATYNWDELDENPTQQGKEELLAKVNKFITDKITVKEHKAGVRPTVIDRRPMLGVHPEFDRLCVFNGMGTKGVMIAPYFAQKMVSFLMGNEEIPEEVNINRFKIES